MSTAPDDAAGVPKFDWKAFTPGDSPKTPMDVHNDPDRAKLYTPDLQVGEQAYNFSLPVYDFSTGVQKATENHFDLRNAAAEKPVALIFGSYT